jgi:phenylpropionate dioxygenase-like ring-hydroxylating dioxygenase large terminal subunit
VQSASPTKRWIDDYPELDRGPVSTEPCTSQAYFDLERDRVYRKIWLKIGRVEQIPNAGDYFVRDIAVCGLSIIVARSADGRIRAFHNVCRHRGNKLVQNSCKHASARTFRCNFHGWTYANDGRLAAVPDEAMFYDLDKTRLGLETISLETWGGFIFINLDPERKENLAAFLAEMRDHLGGFQFSSYPSVYGYQTILNANWKICLDAFSEAYHFLFVHKDSVGHANINKENPMSHPLSVNLYARHRSAAIAGNPTHIPAKTAKLAGQFGLTSMARGQGMNTLPPQINPDRRADFNLDLNVIFPNFIIHVRPGEYFTHQFWPLSHDRTLWEGMSYMPTATKASERFSQAYSHLMRRNVWLEDTSTIEATQIGLATRALTHFTLSDAEILVRHSYKVLEEHVRASSTQGDVA